jgi:hypothetical protein
MHRAITEVTRAVQRLEEVAEGRTAAPGELLALDVAHELLGQAIDGLRGRSIAAMPRPPGVTSTDEAIPMADTQGVPNATLNDWREK